MRPIKNRMDVIGQTIEIGTYIAYATRQSSTVYLNIGRVVGFQTKEDSWRGIHNVTIAWGIDNYSEKPKRQLAKSYIENNHLMVVLDPEKVPEDIKKVLEPLTINTPNQTWSARHQQEEKQNGG